MRLRVRLALTAVAVLPAGFSMIGSVAGLAQRIVVSIEGEGRVAILDAASLRTLASARVGVRPHNLALLPQGLVVVATQGADSISVLDTTTLQVVRTISVGAKPHDVAADPDGRRAYVLSGEGLLLVVDVQAGRVLRRISLGGRPHDLVVIAGELWVTDLASPSIRVINLQEAAPRAIMALPGAGHDLVVRPGYPEVWVTPWSGNTVVVVGLSPRRLEVILKVGRSPQHPAFTPDGQQAWITETSSRSVHVVDASRRRLVANIPLGGPPHHVTLDQRRAYIAVGPSHLVTVDVHLRTPVGRVRIGTDPHDVIIR